MPLESEENERPEGRRRFFPLAWLLAANEGLIGEEEYLAELTRHSQAENARTIPGIPWRNVPDDPSSRR